MKSFPQNYIGQLFKKKKKKKKTPCIYFPPKLEFCVDAVMMIMLGSFDDSSVIFLKDWLVLISKSFFYMPFYVDYMTDQIIKHLDKLS